MDQANIKVGATVIVGLVILAILIFTVSNYHIFGGGKTFFVTFSFANGLEIGAPVMVAGVEVGQVEDITFVRDEENTGEVRVMLTVWVSNEAEVFRNSNAYINTLGLMGEKYLEVTTGAGAEVPLEEGETLRGFDPIRQDQILATLREVIDEFQRSLNSVNAVLDQEGTREDIRNSLHNVNNITKRLDTVLAQNEDNIATGLTNFAAASSTLNNSMSNLDRIITNNEKTLDSSVENFQSTLIEVRETFSENRETLNAAMQDFQSFSHDMATITGDNRDRINSTIANTAAASERLNTVLGQLNHTLAAINSNEGAFGALLNDENIAENLRVASKDIREMIAYVKYRPWLLFNENDEPLAPDAYE